MTLTEQVKRLAKSLGFCAVGVTSADPFTQAEEAATRRTQDGLMDGLSWWSESRVHASADPRRTTPDARSIIALAFPYPRPSGSATESGPKGRIASYALGRDYHEVLLERMQPLVEMLRARGYRAKTYVDHGWMLDRAAAARAGVGWLGKNTNLLVPGVGSSVLLCEIVTSAELDLDQPLAKNCGSCNACMRICPTGALVAPGVLDNRKCISYWTIEHRGVIPREMRPQIGDWVFGCDLCQEVCPVNPSGNTDRPKDSISDVFGPSIDGRPGLEELLKLDEEAFRIRFRQSALWRTRRSGLLRNACIALGNVADRSSVPALRRALEDGDPLVRGHAAWALGRLGGRAARSALQAALRREPDAWVRDECALAIEECGPLGVPSAALPPSLLPLEPA